MKKTILILGAGQSTPYLIKYMLSHAEKCDWQVIVADQDQDLAASRVDDHPRGSAIAFDLHDDERRQSLFGEADLIINLMPAFLQPIVAEGCVRQGTNMVSASYLDTDTKKLDEQARQKSVLVLCECGLDPGIDIMSTKQIIDGIREKGGVIDAFESYGTGVPAPDMATNPLRYWITWNPRNVAMAGLAGAQYLHEGRIRIIPWHQLFQRAWPFEVDGVGAMEAYPNRDSLAYVDVFDLKGIKTMIRGTLRYSGYCDVWRHIVKLGLPNENLEIPGLFECSMADLVEMFLPPDVQGNDLRERTAKFLGIDQEDESFKALEWLGLFEALPLEIHGKTPADAVINLLSTKLALPAGGTDMVALVHDFVAHYPDEQNRRERIVSTMKYFGTPGEDTAMSKTVGLPAALAARSILEGDIISSGCHRPIKREVCDAIMGKLDEEGIRFEERITAL